MSLLSGIGDIAKGAVGIATTPLRKGLEIAGTGLETGGKVLGNLAEGDLAGAASAAANGTVQQVKNVVSTPGEVLGDAKEMAGGYGDVLTSGVKLVGEPVRGAARLVGNGLETSGSTLTNLAEGDVGGAINAQVQGAGNAFGIVGDTAKNQVNNLVG